MTDSIFKLLSDWRARNLVHKCDHDPASPSCRQATGLCQVSWPGNRLDFKIRNLDPGSKVWTEFGTRLEPGSKFWNLGGSAGPLTE